MHANPPCRARKSTLAAQLGAAEQFIALYRSLGGGWESYQSLPPAHIPQPAVIAAFQRVSSPGDPLK
jgi:hypothetical protein